MIEVAELAKDTARRCDLTLVAGAEGFDRRIEQVDLHRPGLALAGFVELFPAARIQLIGNTESLYLSRLPAIDRLKAIERLCSYPLPCIIVTHSNDICSELLLEVKAKSIPLFRSSLTTTQLTFLLSNYLNERFAPTTHIHGTLVDVYGTGLLFIGRAGIGKSEIALDLVERGHRLVADDIVNLTRKAPKVLVGWGPEMLKHMLEIRGVGVIDVRQVFGVRAIRLQKRVETVVELEDWDQQETYERIGRTQAKRSLLGVEIPVVKLPIFPGKNVTVIAEAIALQMHLGVYGENAAKELGRRQKLSMKRKKIIADYLRWDQE